MKKITLLVFPLFAFSVFSFAQTEQGKIVVSGSSSFSFQNNLESGDAQESSISFSPSIGYFVIDDLALNVGVGLNWAKYGTYDPDVSFAIIPGATYYFPVNGMARPFLSAGVGYMTGKQTSSYDGQRYTVNGLVYGGGVGVALFLRDNVSLDLGLNYLRTEAKLPNIDSDTFKSNQLGLGIGFSIFF